MPKYRSLREALHAVDPHLNIVSGHSRKKKSSRKNAVNEQDWEAVAGEPCPKCGAPEIRFIKGICRACYAKQKEKQIKIEANLNPLVYECKDKRLASRVQKYLAKLDRKS